MLNETPRHDGIEQEEESTENIESGLEVTNASLILPKNTYFCGELKAKKSARDNKLKIYTLSYSDKIMSTMRNKERF